MEKLYETPKLILSEETVGETKILYRQHKDDEDATQTKIYELTGDVITYSFDGEVIKSIIFEGFDELPGYMNKYGYGFVDRTLNSFFRHQFNDKRINTLKVSDNLKSGKNRSTIKINNTEIEKLISTLNQEQRACNDSKNILIKNYLVSIFPEFAYDSKETNNNKNLILRNLNKRLLDQLTSEEVEKIGKFFIDASQKFKRPDIVKKMSLGLQKTAKFLTLQKIVAQYESLLEKDPPESQWQEFFNEYIKLFDSRYVHILDYKNISTGLTKYPDIVLVDIYGYIDFYELKKSSTPLLSYDKSHKTWFFSKDVSMVISQASDYLQKAKDNSLSYSKTIKEETATEEVDGLEVSIINPKVIIVAGSRSQLNTQKKLNHFKNLRDSLKDIEFILYDELLERLRNLLDSIKA
jgi:hypothetical protein